MYFQRKVINSLILLLSSSSIFPLKKDVRELCKLKMAFLRHRSITILWRRRHRLPLMCAVSINFYRPTTLHVHCAQSLILLFHLQPFFPQSEKQPFISDDARAVADMGSFLHLCFPEGIPI